MLCARADTHTSIPLYKEQKMRIHNVQRITYVSIHSSNHRLFQIYMSRKEEENVDLSLDATLVVEAPLELLLDANTYYSSGCTITSTIHATLCSNANHHNSSQCFMASYNITANMMY
ncbi:hypothetical protein GOP47_0016638 [Adiantum capillus-veneris]|uniref:Uncharacterized protein n=1 Tax=Adiantum capillus-veneris TaxID=13818 RepID=A0A9D4UI20_ADICA|nr:hypothetical protein GOP47_0016638 [Adiantum capillus-veneris]